MSNVGTKIDEGYSLMLNNTRFSLLHEVLPLKFDYLYTNQLLECIKAKLIINRVQDYLNLGFKIVIFHSYNNAKPSHPFDIPYDLYKKLPNSPRIREQLSLFNQLHPEYQELDLHDLESPIRTLKKAFGTRVGIFNGEVTKSERDYIEKTFNKDGSFKDILIIQLQAGKEGISLHDKTGKHPRVMMNLSLPTRPTDIPQTEGRTYREGLKSNVIYEYFVLHTNFEKLAFALKISSRTRTAENLAVGSKARNFEWSIKEGYINANSDKPSLDKGVGGKIYDMMINTDNQFESAKKSYVKSLERGSKGLPEPIGLCIANWLDAKSNDKVLDPFSNFGEIGRYFKESTLNDFIEPNLEKRAILAINVIKANRFISTHFKELSLKNKYQGIAYSEIERNYQEQAFNHLKDTGRLIMVLKELDKVVWEQNIAITRFEVLLPALLGFRKIVVIDKVCNENARYGLQIQYPDKQVYDLRGITDMNRLFEEVNKIKEPKRLIADKLIN